MPYQYDGRISGQTLMYDVPAGSWYSTETQTTPDALTETIVSYDQTEFERDIELVDTTKIKVRYAGLYNVQFSIQLYNTGGGGSSAAVELWLKKNGVAVDWTGTRVSVTSNSPYKVASWNYFVEMAVEDYVELAWEATGSNIQVDATTPLNGGPNIPSVIVTVNQVA